MEIKIPTIQECEELFSKYLVPANIHDHCKKVRQVANFIAIKISNQNKNKSTINLELVDRLSYLHDLFKMFSLKSLEPNEFYSQPYSKEQIELWKKFKEKYLNSHESQIAYEEFKEQFTRFAEQLRDYSDPKTNQTTEQMIVCYADLRVKNNEVVSINKRFEYLKKRYKHVQEEKWPIYLEHSFEVENKIFNNMDFKPSQLKEKMLEGEQK
jgi:hypothetical protein